MISLFRITGLAGLILILTACAYPVSSVDQGSPASSVFFSHVASGARVLIDGAEAGSAAAFDGKKAVLTVSPGRHQVAILVGATSVFDEPVYVGAGARVEIKAP